MNISHAFRNFIIYVYQVASLIKKIQCSMHLILYNSRWAFHFQQLEQSQDKEDLETKISSSDQKLPFHKFSPSAMDRCREWIASRSESGEGAVGVEQDSLNLHHQEIRRGIWITTGVSIRIHPNITIQSRCRRIHTHARN